jgi:hypothetical protein
MHIANSYNGITGYTKLNQNGDRKYGDYDFWAVARNTDNSTHDTFTWKHVSKYRLAEVEKNTHLTPETNAGFKIERQ